MTTNGSHGSMEGWGRPGAGGGSPSMAPLPPPSLLPPPPPPPRPLGAWPPTAPTFPAVGSTTSKPSRRERRKGRPVFGVLVAVSLAARVGREVLERVAIARWGPLGALAAGAAVIAAIVIWRLDQRRRIRRRGGEEFTPDAVRQQVVDSAVGAPAFVEDGTLLGSSVFVVNQHAKVLEVQTGYSIFGGDGRPLGEVHQIGQSRAKQWARALTAFDQFFTHHFEVVATDGTVILRVTRPAKWFLSKVHVFDGQDRFLGTIRQENVFGKIHFALVDAAGNHVGHLQAQNLRAWDFAVVDPTRSWQYASIVKSWEGWARTAVTRADRYVVKVHGPLPFPVRELTLATALTVDLALKQDARGFG